MLRTDLFLLWNRISHITHYLLPVNTQKHCISNSLKYHASPHFLYRPIDIITLLCTYLWAWLYLSKKKPAVYSHTTDFLYYSFYLLRCVSDKFSIIKHNLCFPAILLHTTWFQHIPVAQIIREIADWSAILSLSNLQSRLLLPCL